MPVINVSAYTLHSYPHEIDRPLRIGGGALRVAVNDEANISMGIDFLEYPELVISCSISKNESTLKLALVVLPSNSLDPIFETYEMSKN